ncbi:MAG: METTL5 family protein [Candidatus Bathyarchaeia archaeon]|nr:50S ribosomal protein L11 methyltransferase [Candidatus Bathyarchaeota archaeon]
MKLRKKQLTLLLSRVEPNPRPKLRWESYMLDAESAASMIHAAWVNSDIDGRKIVDLGCGSGILAIASSLIGAAWSVGVDIDRDAIGAAVKNAARLGAEVDFIIGDIDCIIGRFDTALMNPPFGSWHKGADIKFLKKALEISNVVYSLHKCSPPVRSFLSKQIPKIGGVLDKVYEMDIVISRTYEFHRKRLYPVKADLYRILKG